MISVSPFEVQHIEAAAQLFTARYAQWHATNNLLPPQFASVSVIAPMIEDIVQQNPGVVALNGQQMVGYLTGYSGIPQFKGKESGVVVPVWAHGVAQSQQVELIYPALYTELATEWVSRQCYSQALSYFNPDQKLADVLFGLGFGLLVIDGIRSMEPVANRALDECEIRAATAADIAAISKLDHALAKHLRGAPIHLHTNPVPDADISQHFLQDDIGTFLAWHGGAAIAGIRGVLNMGDGCALLDVAGSLGINFAYTDPVARRNGIATTPLKRATALGRSARHDAVRGRLRVSQSACPALLANAFPAYLSLGPAARR